MALLAPLAVILSPAPLASATATSVTTASPQAAADGVTVSNYTGNGIDIPAEITTGPDGALWFTNFGNNSIGRITTSGVVSNYTGTSIDEPEGITTGPDGALWFANMGNNSIGRITTSGVVTNYPTGVNQPDEITAGPDGALWFTNANGISHINSIGRITTSGLVSTYTSPSIDGPDYITSGPDGALWFTNISGSIGRITTSGVVSSYDTGDVGSYPAGITTGPDGALWFTNPGDVGDYSIGRITTSGVVSHYTGTGIVFPQEITTGPDGSLWFTNYPGALTTPNNHSIGRITTSGVVTSYTDPTIDGPWGITTGPDHALWFANTFNNSIGRIALVTLSSSSLSFGTVAAGSASSPQTVTLTDTGPDPISIGNVEVTTGSTTPSEFGTPQGENGCYDTSLQPGQSCSESVVFAPTSNAPPGSLTQALSFAVNDKVTGANLDQVVSLTGVTQVIPSDLSWGYCFDGSAAAFYGILDDEILTCVIEDQGSPNTIDLLAYGALGVSQVPANETQLLEYLANGFQSGALSASVGVYAAAFAKGVTGTLGSPETFAYAKVSAGVGLPLAGLGVDAQVTLLQSADLSVWGLIFGYDMSEDALDLGLPISFTAGSGTGLQFSEIQISSPAVASALGAMQFSFLLQCPISPTFCVFGLVSYVGPAAVAWVESNFAFWYADVSGATSPVAPPTSNSGYSQASSGSSTQTISPSFGGVTATATGVGAMTVAQYPSDPVSQPSRLISSGEYFDVGISSGNLFGTVSVEDCNLAGGNTLYWFDGSSWEAVAPQSYDASTGCIIATLTLGSSPTTLELVGTVFGVGFVPSQSCLATTRRGPLTVADGQSICIARGGTVLGTVTVQGGGALWVTGGAIMGTLRSNNALAIRLCGTTVLGAEIVEATTGAVVIGDPGVECPGNELIGPVTLTNNTGGVDLIHDGVLGPVAVNGNTGSATEIEGDGIFGLLTCSGNVPPPTDGGHRNLVLGRILGQCAGL